jgi:Domain of unknown function (DUF4835)
MKKIIFAALMMLCCVCSTNAQEINATVTVTATRKIQIADPKIFETLKSQLQDFLNNQKWTEDIYESDERINMSIQLTIDEEKGGGSFGGNLSIQATRPVFNSNYETQLINYVDKDITFFYEQFQPLQYSKNAFVDNLSSIFSYYSFIVLGMDYDTYSLNGGEPYYLMAQEVLNQIPQSLNAEQATGWKQGKATRNRFWLIENILNPRTKVLRQANYEYHRLGLDVMADDPEKGKKTITTCMDYLQQVGSNVPNSMIMQLFMLAKGDELVEIFKDGNKIQKAKAFEVLTILDASNASRYNVLNLN